jgi:hypothetical protein
MSSGKHFINGLYHLNNVFSKLDNPIFQLTTFKKRILRRKHSIIFIHRVLKSKNFRKPDKKCQYAT